MSKWMRKIMALYSGSGQMCASAWIFERFSHAVSWWCPLDSALYSFDRGTVVRKKNQVEHRLHGCINFCANRGLTCKMYGDSAAKVNSDHFSVRPPERASAWIFKRFSQTVSCWCPLQSAFAAGSDVQYFRRKIWITEILIWKSALYWKTLTRADYSRIFWVFSSC